MVHEWQPQTHYGLGDTVSYQGTHYQIVQAHTSQSDWTPPVTPALWNRVQKQDCDGDEKPHQQHHGSGYGQPQQGGGYGQQQPPQQGGGGYGQQGGGGYGQQAPVQQGGGYGQQQPPQQGGGYGQQGGGGGYGGEKHDGGYNQQGQQQGAHPEAGKNWYDIDDHTKHKLEVGGGLVAGLGLLGAGYVAYNHHKKNEEEKKADLWALSNWVDECKRRTAEYHRSGPKGPTTWVFVEGKDIPQYAIAGGEANGQPLYIARAFQEGGIHIGKAGKQLSKGCTISYGNEEIDLPQYEILIGNQQAVKWIDVSGAPTNLQGCQPVEGGREPDGSPLYIAQAPYKGGTHPGKAGPKHKAAMIGYGGKEQRVDTYRVLVYV